MKFLKSSTLLFLLASILVYLVSFKSLFNGSFALLSISIFFIISGLVKINIDNASSEEAQFPHTSKNKLS